MNPRTALPPSARCSRTTAISASLSEARPPTVVPTRVAVATTGERVPAPYRAPSGEAVHYLLGAALGGAYGVLTEYRPAASAGFGGAYGLAAALLLDDAAVPAAGLGPAPWSTPLSTHAYGIASHLVFGTVLEGVRGVLAGRS